MSATVLLEPASPMPVSAQIGRISRDDDKMSDSRLDPGLTSGAHIGLARLIRLDGADRFVSVRHIVAVEAGIHRVKSIP
jgi:hypothetical protein